MCSALTVEWLAFHLALPFAEQYSSNYRGTVALVLTGSARPIGISNLVFLAEGESKRNVNCLDPNAIFEFSKVG